MGLKTLTQTIPKGPQIPLCACILTLVHQWDKTDFQPWQCCMSNVREGRGEDGVGGEMKAHQSRGRNWKGSERKEKEGRGRDGRKTPSVWARYGHPCTCFETMVHEIKL